MKGRRSEENRAEKKESANKSNTLLLSVPLNLALTLSPTCMSLKLQVLEYCSPPVDMWGLGLCPLQSRALNPRETVQSIKQARISMPCFQN